MLSQTLDLLLVVVLLTNFFVLVAGHAPTAIYLVGIQGVVIGRCRCWSTPGSTRGLYCCPYRA